MLCAWAFLLVVILADQGITILAVITAVWVVLKVVEIAWPPDRRRKLRRRRGHDQRHA